MEHLSSLQEGTEEEGVSAPLIQQGQSGRAVPKGLHTQHLTLSPCVIPVSIKASFNHGYKSAPVKIRPRKAAWGTRQSGCEQREFSASGALWGLLDSHRDQAFWSYAFQHPILENTILDKNVLLRFPATAPFALYRPLHTILHI